MNNYWYFHKDSRFLMKLALLTYFGCVIGIIFMFGYIHYEHYFYQMWKQIVV